MTTQALSHRARSRRRLAVTIRAPGLARLMTFAPLCLLGMIGWSALLELSPSATPWAMTASATAAGAALLAVGERSAVAVRRGAVGVVALVLIVAALLSCGVPPELLGPRRWGDLATGLADGLRAVPGIASPYRGDDLWVRSTVLLGGALLAGLATLQAFWPPRPGARRRSPVPAAMSLTMLYAIAVVEVPPERPFLSGAIFAVLLCAFLFADRVPAAQAGPAAACVVVATLLAAAVAPVIDVGRPWLDVARISEDVANTGTIGYSWDHEYGPLDWPREGRELLRVKAQASAYWKTQALDAFDGHAWQRAGDVAPFEPDGETDTGHPQWFQQIEVRVQGLRTKQFVTAGQALDVTGDRRRAVRVAGGTFVPERGILRRGVRYRASVYTPNPTDGELGRAGTDYPSNARLWLKVGIPDSQGRPRAGRPALRPAVSFAPFGSGQADTVTTGAGGLPGHDAPSAITGSGMERTYALARRLLARSDEPYEYVKAVLARVQRGATYTEKPALTQNPLDRFLFDSRRGYCQQFSGAMAVLLRMGGVPARVAVGFTPGLLDRRTGEYVVRDYDAHSWVEAYFPRLGWVTFDPTPAAAPPRDQSADVALARGARRGARGSPGDRLGDARSGGGAATATGSLLPAAGGALAAALAALGFVLARRHRRRVREDCAPELVELERALRICRRPVAVAVTLRDLEAPLGGTEGARGYLRAVASQRYGATGAAPTKAQRKALRHELARGLGRLGRVRAWWAVPPRLSRR